LMSNVHLWPGYRKMYAKYAKAYGNNKYKIRAEIVGQMIGDALMREWKNPSTPLPEEVSPQGLKAIFQKILDWFRYKWNIKRRQEFYDNITNKFAREVVKGNYDYL